MSNAKTIGIVACSSEGAALCYRTICTLAPEYMGTYGHPTIVMHALSLADYVVALERGDLVAVADLMLESTHKLKAAGADFVICPDNTIHSAMAFVRNKSPLPWLHIAEVVARQAKDQSVQKAAILGTKWLVDSEVYPEALTQAGIAYLRPEPEERALISSIIMDELVKDIHHPRSVEAFQDIIARMQSRGCDAVILGCTEIPLIINDGNSALPTLDSTRLLAKAALLRALGRYAL